MLGLETGLLPVFSDIDDLDGPARHARKREGRAEDLPSSLAVRAVDRDRLFIPGLHRHLEMNPGFSRREKLLIKYGDHAGAKDAKVQQLGRCHQALNLNSIRFDNYSNVQGLCQFVFSAP